MSKRHHKHEGARKPCFHCYKLGHSTEKRCTKNGLVSCTNCFQLNVFSKLCNCKNPKKPQPPQVLRKVGNPFSPRWYIDFQLHGTIIPALINTTISRCQVNAEFATWYQSYQADSVYQDAHTILIELQRKGKWFQITCDVVETQKDYIEVGTEFMTVSNYTFTMENVTIDSENAPVSSSPYEREFVYNLPTRGRDLRAYLNSKKFFLKKGRIHKVRLSQGTETNRTVIIKRSRRSTSSDSDE